MRGISYEFFWIERSSTGLIERLAQTLNSWVLQGYSIQLRYSINFVSHMPTSVNALFSAYTVTSNNVNVVVGKSYEVNQLNQAGFAFLFVFVVESWRLDLTQVDT